MKFFGAGNDSDGPVPEASAAEIRSRLDTALTSVFNEDGKKTVLYYLSHKYDLTLEEASVDPSKLEKALTGLLGEVGWMVVKKAILEEFWERKIQLQEMKVVENSSLREAFGIVRGLGSLARFSGMP
ncbi:MAG TPA: hypothetical protein VEB67_00985 [Nitrososphaerales archaeon]|nr:hypothetical protein [Nitrososphaerales archaeon]